MGKWLTCLPRLTLAQLRTLRSTSAGVCHRDLENFPSPPCELHGSLADMPKSILIFQFGSFFVLPGICMCQPRLQTSHRLDVRLTFCSLFAGRRCLCLLRHRHDYVLLDHWQHSFWIGACSCAKLPSPPWETQVCLLFAGRRCLCLLRHRHDYVLLDHRQHSFWIGACSCAKLPSPPWGEEIDVPTLLCSCLCDMALPAPPPRGPMSLSSEAWSAHGR